MPKTITEKLTKLVTAVRRLPEESQAALVDEFAERLSDFTGSSLSEQQRDEVRRRPANPRYADPERGRDFFARYGVRLWHVAKMGSDPLRLFVDCKRRRGKGSDPVTQS